jgi:hypothetical protein
MERIITTGNDYRPDPGSVGLGVSCHLRRRPAGRKVRGVLKTISDKKLLKLCTCCFKEKPNAEFYNHKGGKFGTAAACKECKTKKQKRRYLENTSRVLEINKRWKTTHPEMMRAQAVQQARRRRKTSKGRLSQNIGAHISHVLKGQKAGRKWEILLGFTVDELKRHLEKRFHDGMTWENYGKYWHIDHKIPKAAFNYETPEDIDFKRCWALKNLQPLQATVNMRKGDKLLNPFQPALLME